MLASTAFFNASAAIPGLNLFLDIDPKKDIIKDFFFAGPKADHYKIELQELRLLTVGKTIEESKNIFRSDLTLETELSEGVKAIAPVSLWLLKKAIESYVGHGRFYKEQSDMLCLCFSVTKRDIVKKVLGNKNFELKTLIQDTMASSACGTCRIPIEKLILETRMTHGLIKGLDHAKSRFDDKGQWLKVAGLYPGPLLIVLEDLKNKWMEREKIVGQFKIEFTNIEGLHLTVMIDSTNEKTVNGLLSALTEYLKSELGVLFFLEPGVL
jgi:bacterioferritin-associated ferredoxin